MNCKLLSKGLLALLMLCAFPALSQQLKKVNYECNEVPKGYVASLGQQQINATEYKVFKMDIEALKSQMVGVMHREKENSGFIAQIQLPHPDGSLHSYNARANNTMHPELAAKFSEIKSYDALGANNNTAFVKWDITPQGLHAMIMIPGQSTIFIDPIVKGNTDYYIVYHKEHYLTNEMKACYNEGDNSKQKGKPNNNGTTKMFGTCELRTYRLALSATGEYTTFHGGTVVAAQAAQVTSMNRVNGIYERDMAITMVMVPNNDTLIFTNAGTDPFANGNPGTMINQNQTVCDARIGSANYDIGHVFGTNSGGLAGLGVVCAGGQKARGVTGSASPIGDTFDIDYVAHEMGHQFGANHTQNNNCNRNNATAMEPGSASTIMGYAGICAPNVQSNSDDHFHGISLEEIDSEIMSGGHTCEAITTLANSAPTITGTNGNVTVPAGTPFALTCIATDPDPGDVLSYCWEQMDNQVSTQSPIPTSTGGPNFRSYSPNNSPTRYFPNLADQAAGGPFTWEVIPTVTRTMNFRVTVRDQQAGVVGCNDFADVTVTTDAGSGPFIVNYPSATGIVWAGLTSETVTWSVANTNVAPVACANVDILLSTDGGLTFPTVLASNVPNDGSQPVTVPNIATTNAIIMVICSNGTFFDISDNPFEITMATFDYSLTATPPSISVCQPNDAVYTVDVGSIGGYSDAVTLSVTGVPAGATSNFSVNPVTPAGTSTLTISNTGAATPGTYTLTITGNSTTGIKTTDVDLTISSGAPSAVTLLTPTNGATGVAVPTTFTWNASPEPGVTYDIDIATDAGFASIVDQATGLAPTNYVSSSLSSSTTYYWRVRAATGCGQSAWSSTFSFTTNSCTTYASTNVPVTISASGTPTITSTITIPTGGTINDVNVLNLTGQHTWINDLVVTLTSPNATTVTLWDQVCNNQDDFDLNFDDAATPGALPCPPVGGGTYQPDGLLSSFNGEDQAGVWTLTISDMANQDGGSLDSWSLEICTTPPACLDPTVPTISGSTTICPGTTTTLSIATGALNDATDWEWYSGSCGGTSLGSGTSISVTPGAATTYYVRGEGGCVTPGTCASFTVTPQDVTGPTITCPGNQTENVNASCQFSLPNYTGMATVSDNCDASPTVTQSPAAGTTISGAGTTTTVTLTALDASGNTSSCNFTVTAVDNTAPSISCPGNQTENFNASCQFTLPSYTAMATTADNCDASPTVTQSPPAGMLITGTTTITLTSTDASGNSAQCTFDVVPNDITPPTVTCPGNQTENVDALCQISLPDYTSMATVTDGCDASPSVTQSPAAGTTISGAGTTTTVTITALDASGNSASCNFTVTSVDNTAPSITCPGNQTEVSNASCEVSLPDYTGMATVTDNCDASPVVTQSPSAGTTITSTTTVTVTAIDASGNISSCMFDVSVVDQTPPTITCPGAQTTCLNLLPDYTGMATALDNCDASPVITQSPAAGTATTVGTTTVVMTATDASGNTSTCSISVTVTSLSSNESATICDGETYTFPDGATSTTSTVHTSLLTSTGGCDSTVVTTLTVEPAIDVTTSVSGITITATATGATYQWIDCDDGNSPIAGETSQSFTPTSPTGNYAVIVTIGNCSDTSACQLIDFSGIEEHGASNIQIFPNPTSDNVNIKWEGEISRIEVTDAKGKLVKRINELQGNEYQIELKEFSSGVYFIHIESEQGRTVHDILKQ